MEDDKICEKAMKCPIYNGVLGSNEVLIKTFKNLYCEKGKSGREKCKRYQVSEIAGTCPPNILPNSKVSVKCIIEEMEKSQ